jgi:hypothetical protein
MFDAKELRKVKSDAFARAFDDALKTKSTGTALDNAEDASVLAVAAHVREATLREAAGVCEKFNDYTGAGREWTEQDMQTRMYAQGNAAAKCVLASMLTRMADEAASARETGGKPTLEQSAACLHEKYGDALAKLDDKEGGK